MTRPRLLDLFCCAGGAAMGYHRAGFDIVGIDIVPQPHYPFEFHQGDALTWPLNGFDAIHASPPCQAYSAMSACRPGLAATYPDLVDRTRDRLMRAGVPWVMENVEGSPVHAHSTLDGRGGILLCGSMFNLALYRHRAFEASQLLAQPSHPPHAVPASKAGHWKPGTIISVSGNCSPIALSRKSMGIDWMTRGELSEAIPPAYTEFIGWQLLECMGEAA